MTQGRGRSVLVVGATGLVGRECVLQLLSDRGVQRVVVLVRRPLTGIPDPEHKLDTRIVKFDRLDEAGDAFRVNQVFCALGTTIRRAGSQRAFREVDHDYPLATARLAREHGARHFLLVSAAGASTRSPFFYSRVKGELEDDLKAMGFPSLTIVRPSLLLGEREEFRLGESAMKLVSWAIPGRYAPVQGRDVAAALVRAARDDAPGVRVIESEDIA